MSFPFHWFHELMKNKFWFSSDYDVHIINRDLGGRNKSRDRNYSSEKERQKLNINIQKYAFMIINYFQISTNFCDLVIKRKKKPLLHIVSNFFRLLFIIYEKKSSWILFHFLITMLIKNYEKNNFFNLIPRDIFIILFYAHAQWSRFEKSVQKFVVHKIFPTHY